MFQQQGIVDFYQRPGVVGCFVLLNPSHAGIDKQHGRDGSINEENYII